MRGREHPRVVAVGWTVVLVVALVPTVLAVLGDSWVVLGALTAQLVLALAGLLLWFDPEHRRHGVLLMCASATGGLTNLNSLAFEFGYWTQLGWVLQWMPACFLLPVLLEYPSSRPGEGHGRDVRWLVLLTWVWALGLRLVTALAWDPAFVDYAGPVEWFAVYPSLVIARSAEYVALALLGVIAVWFTVLSVRRWREARGPMRGTVRLVSAAGILLALGLVLRNLSPYALRLEVLPLSRAWSSTSFTTCSSRWRRRPCSSWPYGQRRDAASSWSTCSAQPEIPRPWRPCFGRSSTTRVSA